MKKKKQKKLIKCMSEEACTNGALIAELQMENEKLKSNVAELTSINTARHTEIWDLNDAALESGKLIEQALSLIQKALVKLEM